MNLKLVIDNTSNPGFTKNEDIQKLKTCRTHCFYFDGQSGKCGIFDEINLDDPKTVHRCQRFSDWREEDTEEVFELIEDGFSVEFEDEDFLFELSGDKYSHENSTYPLKPDFPSNREDAIWYISPDKSFACWVINKSKKRFVTVNSNKSVEMGWSKKIYNSPYPLHDHEASSSLKSRMAWYVDEQGWGQYVLLVNGEITMISEPRPQNWKNGL